MNLRHQRTRGEDGVTIVLVAMLMVAIIFMAAIVIDIGFARGSTRLAQSVTDLSALASGRGLGVNNPGLACRDAVGYLNSNATGMPAIDATTFCGQSGNNVAATTCTGGGLSVARPTTTSGRYTVRVVYPVPAAEISDSRTGVGANDGSPCDRMKVEVSVTTPSFFGRVGGHTEYKTTRSATARASVSQAPRIPALWLLDPRGCVALSVGGGAQVVVGTSTVPGVIMVDSDGSQCGGSSYTVSSSGTNSLIEGLDGNGTGMIGLFAQPLDMATCGGRACNPADVLGNRLKPQPTATGERATRSPVDWRFNCKGSYPGYPARQSSSANGAYTPAGCPFTTTRGAYVDQLVTALAPNTAPSGWTTISGPACSPSGVVPPYSGNVWVNCPGGFSIGNGTVVSFSGGNLVFNGEVKMTGGELHVNRANPTTTMSSACRNRGISAPCLGESSTNAAFVYFKSGGLNLTGGLLDISRSAVIMTPDSGSVKVTGGSPPYWTAPTEGPFAGLALWAEGKDGGSQPFQINGGSAVVLSGTFFTPEAVMSLSGGGDWQIPQNAQFIAYRLSVGGGGVLRMSPDAATAVSAPPRTAMLIR